MIKQVLLFAFVSVAFFVSDVRGQITAFKFDSSPTSQVGHGQSRLFTESLGFTFFGLQENGKSVEIWVNGDVYGSWIMHFGDPGSGAFGSPTGPLLLVGDYPIATRWPFHDIKMPGSAGLSFGGQGRGVNTLTGSFVIREFVPSTNGEIQAFAADFIQFDEGRASDWNRGRIRFNSTVPLPEPDGLLLACAIGMGAAILRGWPGLPSAATWAA